MTHSGGRTVGIGVIGAGIMGRSHTASASCDPRVVLRGVAGVPVETAADLGLAYNISLVTDDYRELLANPAIDLITVATPDYLHGEICMAAIEAGKHVFVEKPLTTSLAEADELVEAAQRSDVAVMVSFNHRWIPPYARAYAEIRGGRIGKPRMASARKNDRIFVPTEMLSWADRTTCAWFLSSHDIDLVNWFMGARPVSVYANGVSGVLQAHGVDTPDAIQAQVTYEGGGVATFESCWIYPNTFPTMTDSFIEVIGERGVIHLPRLDDQLQMATEDTFEYPRMSIGADIHGKRSGAVTAALDHMVTCVLEDRDPLISLQSSRDVIAVLHGLHQSLVSHLPEQIQ